VDRVTRKELKADRFAQEVGHTVEYVSEHRRQVIRYGTIAAVVVIVVVGLFSYFRHQNSTRQQALMDALRIQQAGVAQQGNEFMLSFPNQAAKDQAMQKAFSDLYARYPSSEQGTIAKYYLGIMAADAGKMPEAAASFQVVAENGSKAYASLAKLSLAQIYAGENKIAEAEKLLRDLMENPTVFVSKEQATIALAEIIQRTKPAEAQKLLDPLRSSTRPAVSRAAISVGAQTLR
jgi:predicted negative regulator of RcsB-dependent stress response